jgi:predicted phosphodiesterase
MRIAAVSDIHSNLAALRSVLEDIDGRSAEVDRIICLGDLVGRGPSPNEVLEMLREHDVESVRGNYDDAVARGTFESGNDFPSTEAEEADRRAVAWTRSTLTSMNLEYVEGLPRDLRLFPAASGVRVKRNQEDERTAEYRRTFFTRALFGGLARTPVPTARRILALHGSPRALNEFVRADTARSMLATIGQAAQADVLLTSHAAESFQRAEAGVVFVGVGAVSGLRSTPGVAEYAIVEIGSEVHASFESVSYDAAETLHGLERHGLPRPIGIPSWAGS